MGERGFTVRARWRALMPVLAALLLALAGVAAAHDVDLARLAADPPAAEVLAGLHDADLQPVDSRGILFEDDRGAHWWRVTARRDFPAAGEPQLVLESPYSNRVQAWVPGGGRGVPHALFGPDADDRYAPRALVIELPRGLAAGQSAWLRVDATAGYPMQVSVAPRDAVHRADRAHVTLRTAILTALLVLGLLAIGFWVGTGDRSYGYLSGMLLWALLFLITIGGEARGWPLLDDMLARSPQLSRFAALLGLLCSNMFQQRYLDMPRRLPLLSKVLHAITAVVAGLALLTLFSAAAFIPTIGNLALSASALVVVVASGRLAWRGDRPALLLLLSWLPLALFTILRALQLNRLWESAPAWLGQSLAAGFVMAGLLLTLGLAHKLLELRRDRDLASARADVDALTGVASRPAIERALGEATQAALAGGTPLSVVFADIDHFKAINDGHGHHVGDLCLQRICRTIMDTLGEGVGVGRYGGDEFLLLLPRTGLDDARAAAERVRAAVRGLRLEADRGAVGCSLSFGVAEWVPGESMEKLLRRADAALYASKSAGRDRVSAGPPEVAGQVVA